MTKSFVVVGDALAHVSLNGFFEFACYLDEVVVVVVVVSQVFVIVVVAVVLRVGGGVLISWRVVFVVVVAGEGGSGLVFWGVGVRCLSSGAVVNAVGSASKPVGVLTSHQINQEQACCRTPP